MLSSTADNLYWFARYIERAEYLARFLEARKRNAAMPLAYVGETNEWESALATAGSSTAFFADHAEANEDNVTDSSRSPPPIRRRSQLLRDRPIQRPRGAHRVHDGDVGSDQRDLARTPPLRQPAVVPLGAARFLTWVQVSARRYPGSAARTTLRNDAYWFFRLGDCTERADNTARILDVKYHLPSARAGTRRWAARRLPMGRHPQTVSAHTAYHWVYRDSLKPWLVADLLVLNVQCPPRLRPAMRTRARPPTVSPMRMAGRVRRTARARDPDPAAERRMDEVFQSGLHEFLTAFIPENAKLGKRDYAAISGLAREAQRGWGGLSAASDIMCIVRSPAAMSRS